MKTTKFDEIIESRIIMLENAANQKARVPQQQTAQQTAQQPQQQTSQQPQQQTAQKSTPQQQKAQDPEQQKAKGTADQIISNLFGDQSPLDDNQKMQLLNLMASGADQTQIQEFVNNASAQKKENVQQAGANAAQAQVANESAEYQKSVYDEAYRYIGEAWDNAYQEQYSILTEGFWDKAKGIAQNVGNTAVNVAKGVATNLGQKARETGAGLAQGATQALQNSKAGRFAKGVAAGYKAIQNGGNVKDAFANEFYNKVDQFSEGIASTIRELNMDLADLGADKDMDSLAAIKRALTIFKKGANKVHGQGVEGGEATQWEKTRHGIGKFVEGAIANSVTFATLNTLIPGLGSPYVHRAAVGAASSIIRDIRKGTAKIKDPKTGEEKIDWAGVLKRAGIGAAIGAATVGIQQAMNGGEVGSDSNISNDSTSNSSDIGIEKSIGMTFNGVHYDSYSDMPLSVKSHFSDMVEFQARVRGLEMGASDQLNNLLEENPEQFAVISDYIDKMDSNTAKTINDYYEQFVKQCRSNDKGIDEYRKLSKTFRDNIFRELKRASNDSMNENVDFDAFTNQNEALSSIETKGFDAIHGYKNGFSVLKDQFKAIGLDSNEAQQLSNMCSSHGRGLGAMNSVFRDIGTSNQRTNPNLLGLY